MKIGIVSLGLIGGSLFKNLCEKKHEIFAVTRNPETLAKAKSYNAKVSDNFGILNPCDVIFVASPISETENVLDKLENIVSNSAIVLDCASVKEFITRKKRPYKFIGSHPMAGTEFSGFDASFPELFNEAKWILTPAENIEEADIKAVSEIIGETGAKVIIATAKEHDEAVALISHMPLLVAQAIYETAKSNPLALKIASSGFRDMTRLAMSNLKMAEDMRCYNAANIDSAIKNLENSINFLKNAKDLKIFADIKNERTNMYSKEGKNIL